MTAQCECFLTLFDKPGFALDVGANDGLFLSNTVDLEKLGWRVLCIEANHLHGPALWANRKETVIGAVSDSPCYKDFTIFGENGTDQGSYSALTPIEFGSRLVVPVRVNTLNWYLEKWAPPQLDLLCMDIEGEELNAMKGFDLPLWRPKVICVESWNGMSPEFAASFPGYEHVRSYNYDLVLLRQDA